MPLPKKRAQTLLSAIALAVSLTGIQAHGGQADNDAAARCQALTQQATATLLIDSASLINAGAAVPGARLPGADGMPGGGVELKGLPAFCRVIGHHQPETGSDIGFEVWLPASGWDGRFHGVGIGGFAGSIDYLTLSGVLRAGQAGAATDTGHKGGAHESAWAKGNPQKVRDYGWRAVHLTTVAAKQLITGFYGKGPDHSYFVGCSGGGRQGLIEASRYPEDYDGVLAGAPAASWAGLAMSLINAIQAQQGEGAAIRPEQAKLLESEVLAQCDSLDGQQDGLVADPRRCDFEDTKLACGSANSPQCFTPPQMAALRRIVAGPHDSAGKRVAHGYLPVGSETGTPLPTLGWETYLLRGNNGGPAGYLLTNGLLQHLVQQPFATPESFDFDRHPPLLRAAVGGDLDVQPNLQAFFARGGKLILWHGWADAAIPPDATLDLHRDILAQSGAGAAESTQLFMVPGVQHCFGGTGPSSFGQLGAPPAGETAQTHMVAALQAWVEDGSKPTAIAGRYGLSGFMGAPIDPKARQHLLCAEPAIAVLQPGGDPDRADGYRCELPTSGQ